MREPGPRFADVHGAMMSVMKKTVSVGRVAGLAILAVTLSTSVLVTDARAAGGGQALESPRIDQGNEKSLQRGAQAFVNYCMGCHNVGYQRYSRLAEDLGLSEEDVTANLIFTSDEEGEPTKIGALMENAMSTEYGKTVFGVAPPNLSLTARSRGTDWIYTFLKSFYVDTERAGTGVNNTVYPGTAMPHVLWPLQGWQEAEHGDAEHPETVTSLTLTTPGSLDEGQYNNLIADITNFLAYVSDPIKETRHRIGMFVLLFLFALLAVAWFLKKEYWKDVI